jgi:ketosteroid isomerase-like protein
MRRYFDALFSKDLSPVFDALDEQVEWLIVPTGDTYNGIDEIRNAALNHWGASTDRTKTLVSLLLPPGPVAT